jgi:hypothetical protein
VNTQVAAHAYYDAVAAAAQAERVMLDQLAGWQDKCPDVTVQPRPVHGFNPGQVLVETSQDAGLAVTRPQIRVPKSCAYRSR